MTSMNFLKQKDSLAFFRKQKEKPNGKTYELEHVLFLRKKKDRKKECAKISSFFAIYTNLFLLNRFKPSLQTDRVFQPLWKTFVVIFR